MPTIVLTEKAESDLDAIHEYYESQVSSKRADQVIDSTYDAIERLETFPGLGRPSQHPDVRELVLTFIPFIVPYRVVQTEIQILRVLHQSVERRENW